MNILYIAYSCSPYAGSEDKIGWSIPYESSKTNHVIVITKEEQRRDIENFLQQNQQTNMDVHYVDIPRIYKKLFKGFLYSGRLNVWQKRAFALAEQYCAQHPIDVIHQVTPVEFRAVGEYFRIPNVKFVCGPLGGGESIPVGLRCYASGHWAVETVRGVINRWCRFTMKLSCKLDRCDVVMFANRETRDFLTGISKRHKSAELYSEIGLSEDDLLIGPKRSNDNHKCRFLSAGRMIYRKGYDFLLDALEQLPEDLDYEFHILGCGPELDRLRQRCANNSKLSKHVFFAGAVPYDKMKEEYSKADVFVMPSIRETTGSVLLEAMSKGLPVITIGKFGGALLMGEESGWLLDGYDQDSYIDALSNALEACIRDPEEVIRRGNDARSSAKAYTWKQKNHHYQEIYRKIIH